MRRVNLRQIEVFKAVIEHGTVSAAAAALNVSQPAVSKTLAEFEADSGLRLFDRGKGRLAPTEGGMQLHAEIDRIFSGVQQVENAIEALRRQAQGRLLIGVMPALSGAFVQRVVAAFLKAHPGTYCSVEVRSSEWVTDALVGRRLDVGFVSSGMGNPYVEAEPLAEHALVCIMPLGHPLARRRIVAPADLAGIPYVSFGPETATGQRIMAMLAAHGVELGVALVTNVARTLCEFVAAGTGVSLVHPLMVSDLDRVVVRPFAPGTTLGFLLCRGRASRNERLTDDFVGIARATAGAMLDEVPTQQGASRASGTGPGRRRAKVPATGSHTAAAR